MNKGNSQSNNKPIRISVTLFRMKFKPHLVIFCVVVSSRGPAVSLLGSVLVTLPPTTAAGTVTSFDWVYLRSPVTLADGSIVRPGLRLGAERGELGMNKA